MRQRTPRAAHRIVQMAYGEMGDPVLGAFLGDPRFSVLGIVTPPPPLGFYRAARELPVEARARAAGVEVVRTESLSKVERFLARLRPDAVVTATFNKVFPARILRMQPIINVHHGTLPRYRGRANVNWAILNGLKEISVSIHETAAALDGGRIYRQDTIPIGPDDTVRDVYDRICSRLAEVLPGTVDGVLSGRIAGRAQDPSKATYCCTRVPRDGLIDWGRPTREVYDLIRALTRPFPGAFTFLDDEVVRIWSASPVKAPRKFEGRVPGRVTSIRKGEGVEVLTGDGLLLVREVESSRFLGNASELVHSAKQTFGLDLLGLFQRIARLEAEVARLGAGRRPVRRASPDGGRVSHRSGGNDGR